MKHKSATQQFLKPNTPTQYISKTGQFGDSCWELTVGKIFFGFVCLLVFFFKVNYDMSFKIKNFVCPKENNAIHIPNLSQVSQGVSVSEGATQNAHKWALSQTSCVHCTFAFGLMFDHSMFRNLSPWSKNFPATHISYAIWRGMVTRSSADGLQAVSLDGMLPFIGQDPLSYYSLKELLSPLYCNAAFSMSWVVICGTFLYFLFCSMG